LEIECIDFGSGEVAECTDLGDVAYDGFWRREVAGPRILRMLRITDFGMVGDAPARSWGAARALVVAKAIGVATSFELVG
jgi:hypothetical protein